MLPCFFCFFPQITRLCHGPRFSFCPFRAGTFYFLFLLCKMTSFFLSSPLLSPSARASRPAGIPRFFFIIVKGEVLLLLRVRLLCISPFLPFPPVALPKTLYLTQETHHFSLASLEQPFFVPLFSQVVLVPKFPLSLSFQARVGVSFFCVEEACALFFFFVNVSWLDLFSSIIPPALPSFFLPL